MGDRGIIGSHPFWGSYASAAVLPNAAAGPAVGTRLLVGDRDSIQRGQYALRYSA